jgi:hypothetical protein
MFNYTDAIGPGTKSHALSCHRSCFFTPFSVSHRRVNNGRPSKRRNSIGGAHERVNLAESTPNNFIRATPAAAISAHRHYTQYISKAICSIGRAMSISAARRGMRSGGGGIFALCLPPAARSTAQVLDQSIRFSYLNAPMRTSHTLTIETPLLFVLRRD